MPMPSSWRGHHTHTVRRNGVVGELATGLDIKCEVIADPIIARGKCGVFV